MQRNGGSVAAWALETIAKTDHAVIEECYHDGELAVLKRARNPQDATAVVRWRTEVEMLQSVGRHVSTTSSYLYCIMNKSPLLNQRYTMNWTTICYKHIDSQHTKS